ncbi:hypothetical protein GH714_013360 [Hevea brasiliensis]|uniref:Uncharacterized protein n=1 Tax=Hevea brasiliensis TaxID=3981 RepID=A0A6A6LG71_HEVBR|nr:hypothetical protein GH714_013360 [Hevea brasiliensis]
MKKSKLQIHLLLLDHHLGNGHCYLFIFFFLNIGEILSSDFQVFKVGCRHQIIEYAYTIPHKDSLDLMSKGMRTVFFKPSPSSSPMRSPPHRHTFSDTLIDENIDNAHIIISKWDSDSTTISSLFTHDRQEAMQYLTSVKQLQSAMQYYITENSASEMLVRAQNLMQIAMKRLEKEFYQILKFNREYLDPESVSSHSSRASRSSVSDLKMNQRMRLHD